MTTNAIDHLEPFGILRVGSVRDLSEDEPLPETATGREGGPLPGASGGELFKNDYFVLASGLALASGAILLSVLVSVLASVLALVGALPSMLVAVILYLIITRSPFLISPLVLVFLSRAISQFSVPFLTMITSSFTSTTGPVTW